MVPQVAGATVLTVLVSAWLAWLALGALGLAAWARSTAPRHLWLLLFVGALALRLAAPAVQHDLNPRIDEVFSTWRALDWRYAHGLVALLRIVWAVGIPVDAQTPFHVVAVFGALTVVWTGLLVQRLGGGTVAAACAALTIGGLGVHVRYSHTDAPQIVEAALTVAAALLLSNPGVPRFREVGFAGLTLGLAAAMRPEGIAIPVLLLLWSAAAGGGWDKRRLLLTGAIAALVVVPDFLAGLALGASVGVRGAGLSQGHGLWSHGITHLIPWAVGFVPATLSAWIFLAPAGRPPVRVTLASVVLLVALGSLVANAHWSIAPYASWCLARHQLRVLPWMALLVGLGAESVVDRVNRLLPAGTHGPVRATAILAIGVATASTTPDAYARFTLAEEYTFVREHLQAVPPGCTVTTVPVQGDQSFVVPQSLKLTVGTPHDWVDLEAVPADASCVVYYRSAMCTAVGSKTLDLDRCAEFERAHPMTALVEAGLVDRGWLMERFGGEPVRVGFYRLDSGAP